MKTIIYWKPVDKNNPIPNPENERQVLVIYYKTKDNEVAKLAGYNPYITVGAKYPCGFPNDIPIDKFLYWAHQWLIEDNEGKLFVYDDFFEDNLQYAIYEYPKA